MSWHPALRFHGPVPRPVPVYRDVWPGVGIAPPRPLWFPSRSQRRRQRAAVAYVNGTTAVGSSTSGVINVPGSVSNGHFLMLTFGHQSAISNPAITGGGWNYIMGMTTALGGTEVWHRLASSEPASYTVTWTTSSNYVLTMTAFSGVDSPWPHPVLAHSGGVVSSTSPYPLNPLLFQSCDHMLVSAITRNTTVDLTPPGSWTGAVQNSTGSVRGEVAYRSITATAGFAGATWSGTGGASASTYVLALRASGNSVLSLRTGEGRQFWGSTSSGTSCALTVPGEKAAGDLIVVLQASRVLTSGSNIAFGTPSGYTKKGSDQFLNQTNNRMAAGVLYKVATGSDAVTITAGATCSLIGLVMIFGTGSGGIEASLPGTMGQANDTTANTVADIPAMTLEDYAEDNILFAYATLAANIQAGLVKPSGFTDLTRGGVGTNNVSGYIAAKMNGSANPGATSWTSNVNVVSQGLQFAVGTVLEGAPNPDVTGQRTVWVG